MKIRDQERAERPRERLLTLGPESLSDAELLALLLRTGTSDCDVLELAARLRSEYGSLRALSQAGAAELASQIRGIGHSKAALIAAAFELGKRAMKPAEGERITESEWCRSWAIRLQNEPREFLVAGLLDAKGRLLSDDRVGWGGLSGASLDFSWLLRRMVRMDAPLLLLGHNHPCGTPTPSEEDVQLTRWVETRLTALDMTLVGHYIFAGGASYRIDAGRI